MLVDQNANVEVRLLGEFGAYRQGRRVAPTAVASRKARILLAMLPSSVVGR